VVSSGGERGEEEYRASVITMSGCSCTVGQVCSSAMRSLLVSTVELKQIALSFASSAVSSLIDYYCSFPFVFFVVGNCDSL